MERYCLNLLNIDETHPGVCEMLENGALSMRRTVKPFSRTAVDLTLEQTVNADAASRLTGIAAFTHSENARRHWMVTRSVRRSIVGNPLLENITKDLKPYRIAKNNNDLSKLIDGIRTTMNPFIQEPDTNLYCIATGKKVSDKVKDDLLGYEEKGQEWCNDFKNGFLKTLYALRGQYKEESCKILRQQQ